MVRLTNLVWLGGGVLIGSLGLIAVPSVTTSGMDQLVGTRASSSTCAPRPV